MNRNASHSAYTPQDTTRNGSGAGCRERDDSATAGVFAAGGKMSKIIKLPANFIGKEDREKLESFGGHTIAHARATRWHWDKDADGNDVFEMYRGGTSEMVFVRINRDRELDAFCARDPAGSLITSGALEHVFTELEKYLVRLYGDAPDPPA
jgi:hypothetical protein